MCKKGYNQNYRYGFVKYIKMFPMNRCKLRIKAYKIIIYSMTKTFNGLSWILAYQTNRAEYMVKELLLLI